MKQGPVSYADHSGSPLMTDTLASLHSGLEHGDLGRVQESVRLRAKQHMTMQSKTDGYKVDPKSEKELETRIKDSAARWGGIDHYHGIPPSVAAAYEQYPPFLRQMSSRFSQLADELNLGPTYFKDWIDEP